MPGVKSLIKDAIIAFVVIVIVAQLAKRNASFRSLVPFAPAV